MTAHTHTEFKPGCYRCDISKDEYIAALEEQQAELEAERDVLRAIVAELAATHPQNGYYCGHCGTPMNNHALPPDTYLHTPDCLWVCARQAIKETP